MKKYIFIILTSLIFFITSTVSAVVYDEWTEEKENDENLVYETKTLYKWYKEEKRGEYLLYDIVLDKYPYNDLNDTIYSEYSNWLENCPASEYRKIEYKDIYNYKTVKKINYIKIENISKNNKIEDIIIKSHDKRINFTLEEKNEKYIEKDNYFYTTAYAIFKLEEECDANKLYLSLKTKENYQIFSVYFYNNLKEDYTLSKKHVFTGLDYNIDKTWLNENNPNLYTNILKQENVIENDFTYIISKDKVCRYQDILTYHYDIIKQYYDDEYHENVEGYKKDYSTKKVIYKYENIIGKNNSEYEYINKLNNSTKKDANNIKIVTKASQKLASKTIDKKKKNNLIYFIIITLLLIIYIIIKKCRAKQKSTYVEKV